MDSSRKNIHMLHKSFVIKGVGTTEIYGIILVQSGDKLLESRGKITKRMIRKRPDDLLLGTAK
jgi:hypothetical protein